MRGCRNCGEAIAWTTRDGRNVPTDPATNERHVCKGVIADRLKKPVRHHVSASSIERHEECQYRFFHEKILESKGAEIPREEADAGKLAHTALEGVAVERAASRSLARPVEWGEVQASLERAAGLQAWTNPALVLATDILREAVEQRRIDFAFVGQDEHGPIVERGFEIPLGEDAIAGGVLDLVEFIGDPVRNVRDYKTGGWRDPSPATSPQVGLYGLFARSVWSTKDVRVTLQYLALGEEDEIGGRALDRAIDLATTLGRGLVRKMRTKADDASAWTATYGSHCSYCPFTQFCAVYKERTGAAPPGERPVIELGLAEIAEELHRIEPAASLYDKRVKALRDRGKQLAGARVGSDGRALVGRWPITLRTENVKAHERQASVRQILKIGEPLDLGEVEMRAEFAEPATDAGPALTNIIPMHSGEGAPGAPAGGDGAGPGSGVGLTAGTPAPSQPETFSMLAQIDDTTEENRVAAMVAKGEAAGVILTDLAMTEQRVSWKDEHADGIRTAFEERPTGTGLPAEATGVSPAEPLGDRQAPSTPPGAPLSPEMLAAPLSRAVRDDPRPGDRIDARGIAYEVLTVDGGGEDIGVKITEPGRATFAEHITLDLWRRTFDAQGAAPTPSGPAPAEPFHSLPVVAWLGAAATPEMVAAIAKLDDKQTHGILQADAMKAIQAAHGRDGLLEWFAHTGVIVGGDVNGARMRRAFAKPVPSWVACPSCSVRVAVGSGIAHRCSKSVATTTGDKATVTATLGDPSTLPPTCCTCGGKELSACLLMPWTDDFACSHPKIAAPCPHDFCASCADIARAKGATPIPEPVPFSLEMCKAVLGGTEAAAVTAATLGGAKEDESLGSGSSRLLEMAASVHGRPAMEAAWYRAGGRLSGGEKPRRIALTAGQGRYLVQVLAERKAAP